MRAAIVIRRKLHLFLYVEWSISVNALNMWRVRGRLGISTHTLSAFIQFLLLKITDS